IAHSAQIPTSYDSIRHNQAPFRLRPCTLIPASHTPAAAIVQHNQEDLRHSDKLRVILVNRDLRRTASPPLNAVTQIASSFLPLSELEGPTEPRLQPGEVRVLEGRVSTPILSASPLPDLDIAAAAPRLRSEEH